MEYIIKFKCEVTRECIVEAKNMEKAIIKFKEGEYEWETENDIACDDIEFLDIEENQ
jgi:hypothetical protein